MVDRPLHVHFSIQSCNMHMYEEESIHSAGREEYIHCKSPVGEECLEYVAE